MSSSKPELSESLKREYNALIKDYSIILVDSPDDIHSIEAKYGIHLSIIALLIKKLNNYNARRHIAKLTLRLKFFHRLALNKIIGKTRATPRAFSDFFNKDIITYDEIINILENKKI